MKTSPRGRESRLRYAARVGDLARVQRLVDAGVDVNARSSGRHGEIDQGRTALEEAIAHGHRQVVECLLKAGATVEDTIECRSSAMHDAVRVGSIELVRLLLANGCSPGLLNSNGYTPLHRAVRDGHTEIARTLLRADPDIANTVAQDGTSALHLACRHGHVDLVRLLLENNAALVQPNKAGRTPVHEAAHEGHREVIQLFVDKLRTTSVSVQEFLDAKSESGSTALHEAALMGNTEVVEELVVSGATIDIHDKQGYTAMYLACLATHFDSARYLLQNGADSNLQIEETGSLLHDAIARGSSRLVQFLIDDAKANNASFDSSGRMPIHLACTMGDCELIERLLQADASLVDARTTSGDTSLHIAVSRYLLEVARCLVKHGASLTARNGADLTALALGFSRSDDMKNIEFCRFVVEMNSAQAVAEDDSLRRRIRPGVMETIEVCVEHLIKNHKAEIPLEVFQRGARALQSYVQELEGSSAAVHRHRVCVVGPAEWGKTSLIKSVTNERPCLEHPDDRTVGIDLFSFTFDHEGEKHEVMLWDFAGQDVYHVAHTLFFSPRTLFLLVVDLNEFASKLPDSKQKNNNQLEQFVDSKIIYWLRIILARAPDADVVIVGTKHDLQPDKVDAVYEHLSLYVSDWASDMLKNKSNARMRLEVFKQWGQKHGDVFLTSSLKSAESVTKFRETLKSTLLTRKKGFLMPDKYALVLNRIHDRRKASAQDCKYSLFVNIAELRVALVNAVPQLEENLCDDILETLHDLGDILWYKQIGDEILKKYVMLAPDQLISFVREALNHELFELQKLTKSCPKEPEDEPSNDATVCVEHGPTKHRLNRRLAYVAISEEPSFDDWSREIRCEGRINHSLLIKLPFWSDANRHEIDERIQLVRQYCVEDALRGVSDAEIEAHLTDKKWLIQRINLMAYYVDHCDEQIRFIPWLSYLFHSTTLWGQLPISEMIEQFQRYSKDKSITDREAFCMLFDKRKRGCLLTMIDFELYEASDDASTIGWIDALIFEQGNQEAASSDSNRINNVDSEEDDGERRQFPFSFVDEDFIHGTFIDESEHTEAVQLFRKYCNQENLDLTDDEILEMLLDPSRRQDIAKMMDFRKYWEDDDVGSVRWIDMLHDDQEEMSLSSSDGENTGIWPYFDPSKNEESVGLFRKLCKDGVDHDMSDDEILSVLLDPSRKIELAQMIDFGRYMEQDAPYVVWVSALMSIEEKLSSFNAAKDEPVLWPMMEDYEYPEAVYLFRRYCNNEVAKGWSDEETLAALLDTSQLRRLAQMIDFRKYFEDSEVSSTQWIHTLKAISEMPTLVQVETDDIPLGCCGRLTQFFRRVSRLCGIGGDEGGMSHTTTGDLVVDDVPWRHLQIASDSEQDENTSSQASTPQSDSTRYRGQEVLDLEDVEERLLALKSLLFAFGLAYPAEGGEMTGQSDLIFPAYWKMADDRCTGHIDTEANDDASDGCFWSYTFYKSMYPTTLFELLIVRSYIPNGQRVVTTPTRVVTKIGNIGKLLLSSVSHDNKVVIRAEARAVHPAYARRLARFGCMTIERLLDEHEGVGVERQSNEEGKIVDIDLEDEDEDDYDTDESSTESLLGEEWLQRRPWRWSDWNNITLPVCVDLDVSDLTKKYSTIHVKLQHSNDEQELWSTTADQHTSRLHAHNVSVELRDCVLQVTCEGSSDEPLEIRRPLGTLLADVDSSHSVPLSETVSKDVATSNAELVYGAERQGHFEFKVRMDTDDEDEAEDEDVTAIVHLTHHPLCTSQSGR